jgi:hypothetical protein
MVEFVWHQKADGFTDEALQSHTEYWANVVREADWGLMVAAVMTPRFEADGFDFLWVMAWPTQEARDNAWADWAENHEPAWLELTQNTFTYSAEHAYGFAPSPGRQASAPNASGSSVVEFLSANTTRARVKLIARLSRRCMRRSWTATRPKSAQPVIGGPSMTPMFELPDQNTPDYMWTNFWATDAEREAGYAAYAEAEHAGKALEDATCQDPAPLTPG